MQGDRFTVKSQEALAAAQSLARARRNPGVDPAHLLVVLLTIAAVLGDAVNYQIGRYVGPAVFKKEDSRFFKRAHLEKTHAFYERYGGKTIIIDPWFANPSSPMSAEAVDRCDLLLVTHGHFDHMGDAVGLASRLRPAWPCMHEMSLWLARRLPGGADAAIGMIVVQLLANSVLQQLVQPLAMGAALGIHPLAVLIVTIAGGALFGTVGLILAAPLTAAAAKIAGDLARGRAEAEQGSPQREPAPVT